MKVRYTPDALSELEATLDYVAAHSPLGALRVQKRLRDLAELLRSHPFAGPVTDIDGVHRLLATPYPYALYYQLQPDEILVIAIRHTARDEAFTLKR